MLQRLILQHDVAHRGVARGREHACTGEQLTARRGEQRAETGLPVLLRDFRRELQNVDRAERRLDALAVRFAHVDEHVRLCGSGSVRTRRALGNLAACGSKAVDKGRHGERALAVDHANASGKLGVGGEDRFDSAARKQERLQRRTFVERKANVRERAGFCAFGGRLGGGDCG